MTTAAHHIRTERNELAAEILRLIVEFEKRNGVAVTQVNLSPVLMSSGSYHTCMVELELRL